MKLKNAAKEFLDFLVEEAGIGCSINCIPREQVFKDIAEKLVETGFLFKDEDEADLYHMEYPELSFTNDRDLARFNNYATLSFENLPELHRAARPDIKDADIKTWFNARHEKLTFYGDCDRIGWYKVRYSEDPASREVARLVALMANMIRRYARDLEKFSPEPAILKEAFEGVALRIAPHLGKTIFEESHLLFRAPHTTPSPRQETLPDGTIIIRPRHTQEKLEPAFVEYSFPDNKEGGKA